MTARKRKGKVVEASVKPDVGVGTGCTGVKKSTNKTSGQCVKANRQGEGNLLEKDQHPSPYSAAESLCSQLPEKCTPFPETTKRSSVLKICPGKTLHPSAKIKLQLFPIDEGTRIGLEKDGHHPYLELTLRARKKISSVLRHLNSKWGSSTIALGELMLFPYSIVENLASSLRWSSNDIDIRAGDVYAAIESPGVFRLRYGWFSNPETETFGLPSPSTPFEASLQPEGIQKGHNNNIEKTYGNGKQIEVRSEEFKPISADEVVAEMSSNGPIDPVEKEKHMDSGLGKAPAVWADGLTNISIEGLLSEASLQEVFNACDKKSNGSNAGLRPSQLISDSFDAFIAAQTNRFQGPRLSSHEPHSSILDAEDTCHAFPSQRFSTSSKDVQGFGGSAFSGVCNQDAGSEQFKVPNATEVNIQSEHSQGHACQESETNLLLCARVYNDERSLGLSGIKWTDSLGPFDLGLSSSRKISSGDSIGISGIVR